MATVIHSGGDLRPVYVLFLAWVPLYAAYFFGWAVGLAQSALAGIACGYALEPNSGTAVEYAVVAIPLLVSPLALAVFLRRREHGLAGERIAAPEEFRKAQKREPIGRRAGGVAHEVNNPRTVIGGYAELLASGLVITGGSTQLEGMPELAEEVCGMQVRRGVPRQVGGLVDVVRSPMYATGVGLVLYGCSHQDARFFKIREQNVYGKVIGRMQRWLNDFLA